MRNFLAFSFFLYTLGSSIPAFGFQEVENREANKDASKAAEPTFSLTHPLATPSSRGLGAPAASMPNLIDQFRADAQTIDRRFRVPLDKGRAELAERLLKEWQSRLTRVDFDALARDGQVDYLLLRNEIEHRLALIARDAHRDEAACKLLPYLEKLQSVCLIRENVVPIQPEEIAETFQKLTEEMNSDTARIRKIKDGDEAKGDPIVALRASQIAKQLKRSLDDVHRFYSGYDPLYTWWVEKPYQELADALTKHADAVSKYLGGIDESDKDKIVGQPIGQKALDEELRYAMIPYSAAELVAIAEREFAWCDAESVKASEELGCGGDWTKALNQVKSLHVEPGDQPGLIRELAWEAIRFLDANDLITVPPLAANGWRMDMMTPEAQRVNPYFLGGERIIVSFPTSGMSHQEKLMSLRSNNIHFSRATVQHELIPGHHLQHYMTERYRHYRQIFDTPFWVEGWALYWEMLLWDMDFAKTPEDRVGMLFWRRHRCARIVFSLNYQLGRWSAEECVQYLIDKVGHEPSAAAAEVRRSIMGGYGPLYQAAYMLGGLQIRALHRELVGSGKMTNRAFHDSVIQQNSIPIELIRAALTDIPLNRNYRSQWKFADPQ